MLLPFLVRFFNPEVRTILVDIGANTGDTSASLMAFFTSSECLRYQAAHPPSGPHDDCTKSSATILAYEPMAGNSALLHARAAEGGWLNAGWRGFQMAVTSPTMAPAGMDSVVKFFSTNHPGDQQGGLSPAVSGSDAFVIVNATTIDEHLLRLHEDATPILLLKIDTEGFDAHVLLGAERLFRAKRATFVVFEYNEKWRSAPPHSLASTVTWMSGVGYDCYFITPTELVPLFGQWWGPGFEIWGWSNVMCAEAGGAQGAALVAFFNSKIKVPRC